jgi:hypothetical protein
LDAKRFYKGRELLLGVVLSRPGTPCFESNLGEVSRKVFVDWKDFGGVKTVSLELVYHRMMLVLVQFVGVTAIICGRLIFLATSAS